LTRRHAGTAAQQPFQRGRRREAGGRAEAACIDRLALRKAAAHRLAVTVVQAGDHLAAQHTQRAAIGRRCRQRQRGPIRLHGRIAPGQQAAGHGSGRRLRAGRQAHGERADRGHGTPQHRPA
jgi:hypothetical protein